jgi:hypothetical protein
VVLAAAPEAAEVSALVLVVAVPRVSALVSEDPGLSPEVVILAAAPEAVSVADNVEPRAFDDTVPVSSL